MSRSRQIEAVDSVAGAHPSTRSSAVVFEDGVDAKQIEDQLQRILVSPSFRNSKRHTLFLHFLVEKAGYKNMVGKTLAEIWSLAGGLGWKAEHPEANNTLPGNIILTEMKEEK